MPELPDVVVYLERLHALIVGQTLERVRVRSPFVVRTVDPQIAEIERRCVTGVRRLGKRLVIGFEGDLFLVIHLMIAGRLRWREAGAGLPGKIGRVEETRLHPRRPRRAGAHRARPRRPGGAGIGFGGV